MGIPNAGPPRGITDERSQSPDACERALNLRFPTQDGLGEALVTQSAEMLAILERARRVAASKASVLIEGESGTGKELMARLIHQTSPRASAPFIQVNCAALSEGLVESELFG